MYGIRPTKGPGAQIRRAGKVERRLSGRDSLGNDIGDSISFHSAHTLRAHAVFGGSTKYISFFGITALSARKAPGEIVAHPLDILTKYYRFSA
jgi:hypothetical protein